MGKSKIFLLVIKYLPILLAIILISRFGYILRRQDFQIYPAPGDTFDEYKAPFNGISLLTEGIPKSWSWYENYKDFELKSIHNGNFRLVKPWFDEPAFFSIMVGYYAIKQGMTTFEKVHIGALRQPMVYLGSFNIILLFLLIYLVNGFWPAVFGSLIYASIPTIVLGSRMPLSDNMLVTFSLLSFLFTIIFLKSKNILILILGSIFASASFHLKSTGIFVPAAVIFILWRYRLFKLSLIPILFSLFSVIAWFYYGYFYNWSLFLAILKNSSGRELFSPTVIFNLFLTYRIGEKVMGIDGWILWSWISVIFVFLFSPHPKNSILSLILISYLVLFSIMSGHIKGWYRLPFFPYISWSAAIFIIKIIKNPHIVPVLFFLSLPFFSSIIYGHGGIRWPDEQRNLYQIIFVIFFIPFLFYQIFPKYIFIKKYCQITIILIFLASIFYNYQTIIFFQDFFYYKSL